MKLLKLSSLVVILLFCMSFTAHKFYVSITKIEFSKEQQSVQIITKLFIDDVEAVLQERYDPSVRMDPETETEKEKELLKRYVLQKLKIKINGKEVTLEYLGHEYESDVVKAYIEIVGITDLERIEVENTLLMELFEEQQNIIHVKKDKKRKSMMLDIDNPKGMLNF